MALPITCTIVLAVSRLHFNDYCRVVFDQTCPAIIDLVPHARGFRGLVCVSRTGCAQLQHKLRAIRI